MKFAVIVLTIFIGLALGFWALSHHLTSYAYGDDQLEGVVPGIIAIGFGILAVVDTIIILGVLVYRAI